jgi:hypothetical protein
MLNTSPRTRLLMLLLLLLSGCRAQSTPALSSVPSQLPPTAAGSPTALTPQLTTQPADTTLPAISPPQTVSSPPAASPPPIASPLPASAAASEAAGQPVLSPDCPVSHPNLQVSPDENVISLRDGYVNGQGKTPGTIFTNLWLGNTVLFTPHGPGEVLPDGTLQIKWPWYRTLPGEVHITGRRLDATARPMPEVVLHGEVDGYAATGFHPSMLSFPTQGCWEVMAQVGGASLSMVVRVVQLPFDNPEARWLPEGLYPADVQLSGDPLVMRTVYKPLDGSPGELSLETTLAEFKTPPSSAGESIQVGQASGLCFQGGPDAQDQWQKTAKAGELVWEHDGLTFYVRQAGLVLDCRDLLHIVSGEG